MPALAAFRALRHSVQPRRSRARLSGTNHSEAALGQNRQHLSARR